MGDAADYDIEAGQQGWWDHLTGECSDMCPYCMYDEEAEEEERWAADPDDDDDYEDEI